MVSSSNLSDLIPARFMKEFPERTLRHACFVATLHWTSL